MKTYLVHCHDEDADYTEGVLRAIANSGRKPIEIHESKPISKRPRKRLGEEGSASTGVLLAVIMLAVMFGVIGCDLLDDDDDDPRICCPTAASFELPDGTFHDCGFAPPADGVSCPPAGVSGSDCFAGTCATVGPRIQGPPMLVNGNDFRPCCCEGADGPAGAWCDDGALAGGCVERPIGFVGTCADLI